MRSVGWRHRRVVAAGAGRAANLLDGEDTDEMDLGVLGEQLGANLSKGPRDLTREVRVTGVLGLERVEDGVGRVLQLERVPGHGALLGDGDLAATFEERGEIRAL